MKKLYTFLMLAMAISMAGATERITLDVFNSDIPEAFTFTGNNEMWDSTYSENFPQLVFAPFALSHLCGGASYGGVYWDGFTVCRSADNAQYPESQMLAHQWDVMPGGGVDHVDADGNPVVSGNKPYFLGYWSSWYGSACNRVQFTDSAVYKPVGMYVTNTCYAYYSVLSGTASANAFNKEGDSFKLIAYGVNPARNEETTCEIELAGFHDGEFTALTDWTWWDLSALGECTEIYFMMTSTDVGTWGINTPTYFAMDGLTVETVETSGITEAAIDKQVASTVYYNLAGQQFANPQSGLNIVVTRYTDGTTTTTKVLH